MCGVNSDLVKMSENIYSKNASSRVQYKVMNLSGKHIRICIKILWSLPCRRHLLARTAVHERESMSPSDDASCNATKWNLIQI